MTVELQGITCIGVKSETEALEAMPDVKLEMELAGYDMSKLPEGFGESKKNPEA